MTRPDLKTRAHDLRALGRSLCQVAAELQITPADAALLLAEPKPRKRTKPKPKPKR